MSCHQDHSQNGILHEIRLEWTAEADGSFIAAWSSWAVNGIVVGVKTKPGTPAPTNLYDITLLALDGIDIMGGALANRSSANTEFAAPLVGSDPWMIPVPGPVQLNIVNNIVNGAEGVVKIYYVAE